MAEISARLPTIKATNQQLVDIYTNRLYLTAKEISQEFGICSSGAYKIVRLGREQMSEEQRRYARKIIPTEILFDLYGWNIQTLKKRVKQ